MPASPEYSPVIPPLPSPYGRQGVVPSPLSEEASLQGDYPNVPRNMHPRGTNHYPQQHYPGWSQSPPGRQGYMPGPQYGPPPPPPGYPPFATPHHPSRPPGHTPGQHPYGMYGGAHSPWTGYGPPPPPGHGPMPHSAGYGPGPLPHDPRAYGPPGPTPYQPFHPMNGSPYVHPQGYHGPWGPGGTPMGGTPSLYTEDMGGYPFPPPARPKEDVIRVDKWEAGKDYGPVLTPFQVAILDVQLHVNPLLGPAGDNPAVDQPYLVYNLLFPLGAARRSTDPPSRSWSSGRSAPATWPRVSKLRIISREFPWVFEIEASRLERGVTCLDVIDGLYEQLQTIVPRHHIESLSGTAKGEGHKRRLYEAYHYNRSTARDAPGGSLGEGIRKVDWLLNNTMYDGLVNDQKFVRERLGITGPGWKGLNRGGDSKDKSESKEAKEKTKERVQGWPATFVLKLDVRYGDSDRMSVMTDDTETVTEVSETA